MISVFPQRKPGGKDVIRIWNSQLIAYAGYPCPQDPKVFIGDRGNVTFTQFCQSLGWKGKGGKLDTVQDFLIKLGIKPHVLLWEISNLSLNNVIIRPTKIMNRADKNWAHFLGNKVL